MTSSPAVPSTSKRTLDDNSDKSNQDDCPICLHPYSEVAQVPICSHQFCFGCLSVWTEQSRKCPLCNQSIGEYLLRGPRRKRHPLAKASGSLPLRRSTTRIRSTRHGRQTSWGPRTDAVSDEHRTTKAIERRRRLYDLDLYATDVVSAIARPYPPPAQFTHLPELINRTSAFVRRELRIWPHLDVEWLTTCIIELMRSVDIRSDRAIDYLSEFLDEDGSGTRLSRHFVHEVFTYVCSPFQNLFMYDTAVRYGNIRKA